MNNKDSDYIENYKMTRFIISLVFLLFIVFLVGFAVGMQTGSNMALELMKAKLS
jgi:hypothetical protein